MTVNVLVANDRSPKYWVEFIYAVVLVFVTLIGSASHAQNQDLPPIYFGATQLPNGQTVVKFVFSRRSSGTQQFEPTHAFVISPNREQRKCNTERTNDLQLPEEYARSPLYDSADPQSRLPIEKLPVFFATVVSAELARRGLAKTPEDSLPYHTCTRLLWEQLLRQRNNEK